jgi:hypothetical protein
MLPYQPFQADDRRFVVTVEPVGLLRQVLSQMRQVASATAAR